MLTRTAALTWVALVGLMQGALTQGASQDTLPAVKAPGQLVCGVATSGVGLAMPDSKGVSRGVDADYCRAFAATILGEPAKLRFVTTTTQQRFTAPQPGEVDVLARATTWTFTRDKSVGLVFAAVNLYDGQGFLVKKSLGVLLISDQTSALSASLLSCIAARSLSNNSF